MATCTNVTENEKDDKLLGFFSKLKNLAVKLDKVIPQIKNELNNPQRNSSNGASIVEELNNIEQTVANVKEEAKTELLGVMKFNENIEKELEINNARVSSFENSMTSTLKFLQEYGFSIEEFENAFEEKPEPPEPPEPPRTPREEKHEPPNAETTSKTPNIENFGLSSPTIRLLSNSTRPIIQKTLFTASSSETIPKFDLSSTPLNSTSEATNLTPETPEMTVFLPSKMPTFSKIDDVTENLTSKLNEIENITPKEPELTCHIKPVTRHSDLPPSPELSMRYDLM